MLSYAFFLCCCCFACSPRLERLFAVYRGRIVAPRLLVGAVATVFPRNWLPLSVQTAECTAGGRLAGDSSLVLFFLFGGLISMSLVGAVYVKLCVSVRWFLGLLVAPAR
jgi:hypothetical protein